MTLWRVWKCDCCGSTLKVNKDLDQEEYEQRKKCLCGCNLKWHYNEEDGRE